MRPSAFRATAAWSASDPEKQRPGTGLRRTPRPLPLRRERPRGADSRGWRAFAMTTLIFPLTLLASVSATRCDSTLESVGEGLPRRVIELDGGDRRLAGDMGLLDLARHAPSVSSGLAAIFSRRQEESHLAFRLGRRRVDSSPRERSGERPSAHRHLFPPRLFEPSSPASLASTISVSTSVCRRTADFFAVNCRSSCVAWRPNPSMTKNQGNDKEYQCGDSKDPPRETGTPLRL